MRAFIRLFFIVTACLAIALTCLDVIYSYALSRHPLLRMPSNRHYGNLVIGDSRVSSMLEHTLDSATGSRWIVVSHYGGTIDDVRIALGYFYAMGNRADTVWLSTDMRSFTVGGKKYSWLYHAHESRAAGFLNPRLPFLEYARENANVRLRMVWEELRREVDTSRRETRDFDIIQWYHPHKGQTVDYSIRPFLRNTFDSVRALAAAGGSRTMILFTAPFSPEYDLYESQPENYKDILRSTGMRHIDFSGAFPDTSMYADLLHLKRRFYRTFTLLFADSAMGVRNSVTRTEGR